MSKYIKILLLSLFLVPSVITVSAISHDNTPPSPAGLGLPNTNKFSDQEKANINKQITQIRFYADSAIEAAVNAKNPQEVIMLLASILKIQDQVIQVVSIFTTRTGNFNSSNMIETQTMRIRISDAILEAQDALDNNKNIVTIDIKTSLDPQDERNDETKRSAIVDKITKLKADLKDRGITDKELNTTINPILYTIDKDKNPNWKSSLEIIDYTTDQFINDTKEKITKKNVLVLLKKFEKDEKSNNNLPQGAGPANLNNPFIDTIKRQIDSGNILQSILMIKGISKNARLNAIIQKVDADERKATNLKKSERSEKGEKSEKSEKSER